MKINKTTIAVVAIFCLLYVAANINTTFQFIKLTDPIAIIFGHSQDTISNRTAGTLVFGSMIKAPGFISDTTTTPSNVWNVSPGFTLNIFRKTSPTIQGAIDNIDSGVVNVGPGVYVERVSGKSRVTIKGAGTNRTTILRTDDSCVVYLNRATDVTIQDLTIKNLYSSDLTATRTCIKIRKAWTDTLTVPSIRISNVVMVTNDDDDVYPLWMDSASAIVQYSALTETGDNCSVIYLQNGAKVYADYNKLINATGNPNTGILFANDIRCRATIGYNRILTGYVIFHISTADFVVRSYDNISDISMTDVNNGAVILAVNSNNTFDTNFYLP